MRRFGVPTEIVGEIQALLRRQEIAPIPAHLPDVFIRDPDDVTVVAASIASHEDFLVTGDKDLTSLAPLDDMRISTPRDFWNAISKSRNV